MTGFPKYLCWSPDGPFKMVRSKEEAAYRSGVREKIGHKLTECPATMQEEWIEGELMSICKGERTLVTVSSTGAIWRWKLGSGKKLLDDDWWKAHHPDWRRAVKHFVQRESLGPVDEAMIMAKVAELPAWFPKTSKWFTQSRRRRFDLDSAEIIRRRAGLEAAIELPQYLLLALRQERINASDRSTEQARVTP